MGVVVLAVTLAAALLVGLLWRRSSGRFAVVAPAPDGIGAVEDAEKGGTMERERLSGADLGAEPGERATLVQFSTAFCQPCRATRRILAEVAEMVDGVAHIEVDAEARLDLVRRLDIMRTPTVLVLDAEGVVRTRASGQPRKADVIAALGSAI